MAALLLTTAAQAVSGAVGLGGAAASALQAGAAIAGNLIDQSIFGRSETRQQTGPQLTDLSVSASTEGRPIPRIYGRMRIAGQLIWATDFEEEISRSTSTTGGKGGGGSGVTTTTTTYAYYANVALGLCEGEIAHISRVWADGSPLDTTDLIWRVHRGTSDQPPDPLIESREGFGKTPAYRDTAYVVFERLPIGQFGNRLPQLAFEVWRPIGTLEQKIGGVCIIPGATEFGYDPRPIDRIGGSSSQGSLGAEPENRHLASATSDWAASMDLLGAVLPACMDATLVAAWFGDDLRAGRATIRPRTENAYKNTTPVPWNVAGLTRQQAGTVTGPLGEPAFGGTPNDASVRRGIEDLKSRGKAVTLLPFILMDIPADNALPHPDGSVGQPAYPWRGRITVDGIAEGTSAAADDIATFMGTAAPQHFSLSNQSVVYGGPDEWSYRRFILHYAMLAVAAGGVDTFLIGSEMVALTRVRDADGNYPFVQALRSLAADCRTILGPQTAISYAADWSEYHSHRPDDGSGSVFFHLDPLWADPNIDVIGIDNYFPLSDWRDDGPCQDRDDFGITRPTDPAYLQANIEGGEYHDWYYADAVARAAGARIAISDSAHGQPWVYRQKDIRNWWQSQHFGRTGPSVDAVPSDWIPQSKPIRFFELGCAAVDNASNTPNRFRDGKSSEDGLPWFSRGSRDDDQQRAHIEAVLDYWAPDAGNNPVSSHYGGPMVEIDRTGVWCWDARPLPAFPRDERLWADAGNWDGGHWISGRMGTAPLSALLPELLEDHGAAPVESDAIDGGFDGFAITQPNDGRSIIEPLVRLFGIAVRESAGAIELVGPRGADAVAIIDINDLGIPDEAGERYGRTRPPATEVPAVVQVGFLDPDIDDQSATARAIAPFGASGVSEQHGLAATMDLARAEAAAVARLRNAALSGQDMTLSLPYSFAALEVGDTMSFTGTEAPSGLHRLTRAIDGESRQITVERFDPGAYAPQPRVRRRQRWQAPAAHGSVLFELLDLPRLEGGSDDASVFAAAFSEPWLPVAVYRSQATGLRRAVATIRRPATAGITRSALSPGGLWRTDEGQTLEIDLYGGTLDGVSQTDLLGGFNLAALRAEDGAAWEVIQFRDAELISSTRYRLSGLLRGQGGTAQADQGYPEGSRFILLDDALVPVDVADDLLDRVFSWRFGPSDKDINDSVYQTREQALAGISLKPFAPVHMRCVRETDDDLSLDWIRQTRIGGDRWDVEEVPLGETVERYRIEVQPPGGAPLRSETVTAPHWVYPAADQIADFGSRPSQIECVVRQWSERAGYGRPARSIFHV